MLLDCCYSGTHINKSEKAPSPSEFTNAVIAEFQSAARGNLATSNYQVLTACSKNETSFSFGSYQPDGSLFWYGAFTFAACMGSGYHMIDDDTCTVYADLNRDGSITLGEAYDDIVDTIVNVLEADQSTKYYGDRSFVMWYK